MEQLPLETPFCQKLVSAEASSRTHAKLHELLGNTGLLRELVRIAEVEIVRFGNDTLQKLSDGDLSLELSQEPRADNTALTLLVRKADSPNPIPVGFLSGSQKFRVALAIALGIGQFASGQTRPLESVIIDEGFGSLDKEGLRAAAEELNRLKRHLKRIILVSHQDEFTDHFPVVIQLSKTEDGVTPRGVEHMFGKTNFTGQLTVKPSVTPRGVEHGTSKCRSITPGK